MEQTLKKKKKKILTLVFNPRVESMEREEIIVTSVQIRGKLRRIMKSHIGESNSISSLELFEKVFGINPYKIDYYKRAFWWKILVNEISSMRKDNEVFIIRKHNKCFVLQSKEELDKFKAYIGRVIDGLKNMEKNAEEWVKNKKWEEI